MYRFKKIFSFLYSLTLLLIGCVSYASSELEVVIFDCGQGNTVAARYNTTSMLFDAGRTSYTKFVRYEDDKSSESLRDSVYEITNIEETLLKISVPSERYCLESVPENNQAYKEQFKEKLKDFLYGSDNEITLRSVFISHPDSDHYNLVYKDGINPTAFILGGNYQSYNQVFRDYIYGKIRIIDSQYGGPSPLERYKSDDSFKEYCSFGEDDNDLDLEILSVNANRKGDKNADSMVIKLSHKHSIIISGDAEGETWANVGEEKLKADVLILSHHGSNTKDSTTLDLLKKITPKLCFISAGFQHNHPTKEAIDILFGYYRENQYRVSPHFLTFQDGATRQCVVTDIPVFSTIDNGALTINLSSDVLSVKCERDFDPTPHMSLYSAADSSSLFFEQDFPRTVFMNLKINKGYKLYNEIIYEKEGENGGKNSYYYKFGDGYFKLKLEAYQEGKDNEEGTYSEVEDLGHWISEKQKQETLFVDIVTLEKVTWEYE